FKGLKEVSYVYHDKNGGKHNLGTFDVVKAQKWKKGSSIYKKEWKKIKVGKDIRYYKYDIGKVPLIKLKLPISYDKNGIKITLKDNTDREYINPEAYACLLGALAENDYKDVAINGFTSKDGTGAPSVSHYNGIAGDFRYLRKDKKVASLRIDTNPDDLDVDRTEKFIDALIKFGWSSFYSYDIILNKKTFRLKESHTTHLANH
ncbi:peptidoglycan-binding protein, partial [Tenacibaculum maritimum]